MSIFRRRKADAETAADTGTETELDVVDGAEDVDTDTDAPEVTPDPPVDRSAGPFDASEVEDDDGRLDLGALRIRGAEGMELRLEIDQEQQHVIAATAVIGESALQLQAFAAPRSGGVWADIRSEIAAAIETQGGTADLEDGPLGTELRTRMPSAGPDGRTVFAPARFLGIDGPRWFLRGVISGRGAIDDDAAAPLLDVFRETVVVRGSDPMAPRELLPLRLPQEEATPMPAVPGAEGPTSTDELNPFERGPEITEVR
ncbi:DUF3710 domain-containing protein [Knoellia sp. CPCC 206450]|uniref:DUF3710 domain-containing protein n=1 Tax=Knoellia tibetensis TaxID=3404798 RepID=UPI003B43BD0A